MPFLVIVPPPPEEYPLRNDGVLAIHVGAAQRVGPAVRRVQPDDVLASRIMTPGLGDSVL